MGARESKFQISQNEILEECDMLKLFWYKVFVH